MGVNVTLSGLVPAAGAVVGVVQANVPGTGVLPTEAAPPVSVDEDRVWPEARALATGKVDTVGVALLTVTDIVTVTVL